MAGISRWGGFYLVPMHGLKLLRYSGIAGILLWIANKKLCFYTVSSQTDTRFRTTTEF
jgi:hypothetical protein